MKAINAFLDEIQKLSEESQNDVVGYLYHGSSEENRKSIEKEGLKPKRARSSNMGYRMKDGIPDKKLDRTKQQRASVHLTDDPIYAATFGIINKKGKNDYERNPTVYKVAIRRKDLKKIKKVNREGSYLFGPNYPIRARSFIHEGAISNKDFEKMPDEEWPGWRKAIDIHRRAGYFRHIDPYNIKMGIKDLRRPVTPFDDVEDITKSLWREGELDKAASSIFDNMDKDRTYKGVYVTFDPDKFVNKFEQKLKKAGYPEESKQFLSHLKEQVKKDYHESNTIILRRIRKDV